jgi:hypothetical protein
MWSRPPHVFEITLNVKPQSSGLGRTDPVLNATSALDADSIELLKKSAGARSRPRCRRCADRTPKGRLVAEKTMTHSSVLVLIAEPYGWPADSAEAPGAGALRMQSATTISVHERKA